MRALGSILVTIVVLYFLDSIWFYGIYFKAARTIAARLWLHFIDERRPESGISAREMNNLPL
jgi:hypothetical protein